MTDSSTHDKVPAAANLLPDEQSLLDTALQESDQLLVRSLQDDQRRRARRWLWVLLIGGVAMLTAVLVILFGGLSLGLPGMAEAKEKQPTRAEIEQAEALSAEGWQLWRERREMAAAAEKFEEATNVNPKDANAWNGLGWALFQSGQPTKAVRAFEESVKLSPDHAGALNGLGQLYLDRGDITAAERYLSRAAKNPQASAAWGGLARLYLVTGEFKKALPWAKKFATAEPGDYAQEMLAAAAAGKLSDQLRQRLVPTTIPAKAESTDEGHTATPPADLAECLEDLRRTAVCYNLSFDQVLDEELSGYDESRLELFPSKDAWPDLLGYIEKEPAAYESVAAAATTAPSQNNRGVVYSHPLRKPYVADNAYQTLVFLEGIARGGAVLVDTYVTTYCRGDMAGVINSQSYSTNIIRGNASGRMRNASYGNWVVFGDLSGTFEFESAGTLRVLGDFTGNIKLGSGEYKRRGKVLLAGHTSKADLKRIAGTGTIYLEESDLDPGHHEVGKLTVIVGELD